VSDMEWGWAPFHYGRWIMDPQFGWAWIPGRVWGPAWVSFRYGGDYVGWAPLPPDGGNGYYDNVPSYGYEPSINVSFWNFVPRQHFNDRNVNRYYDYGGNNNYYHKTKNVTNITIVNNRVVNNSINVNQFENDTRQRVVRHRVDVTDQVVPGNQRNRGNDLVIVRPKDVERNAGNPRMRDGSQPTGNQNDNHGKPNQAIVTGNDHGKPNQQGPVQTEIVPGKPGKHQGNDNRTFGTANDQGKPNGNRNGTVQTVLPPPNGKPDKPRGGAGPTNDQGGMAQNLKHNDRAVGNANGVGKPKPAAPVIIPPPDNGANGNKHSSNNGNNNGRNNDRVQANNGRNRPQQEAEQQVLRQNNGQGGQPPAKNNPPAHAPKKGAGVDCGQGNKGCNNNNN
jgi:hypothetical protein